MTPTCFDHGRARDGILLAMSPVVDAKALRAAIKDRLVRAGVLFLRRRRLPQGRGAPTRSIDAAVDPATRDFNFETLARRRRRRRDARLDPRHAADDGRSASGRRFAT